jgi:hypothetical protein
VSLRGTGWRRRAKSRGGGGRRYSAARAWAAWFVLPSLATSAEPVKKSSLHMLCFHPKLVECPCVAPGFTNFIRCYTRKHNLN